MLRLDRVIHELPMLSPSVFHLPLVSPQPFHIGVDETCLEMQGAIEKMKRAHSLNELENF